MPAADGGPTRNADAGIAGAFIAAGGVGRKTRSGGHCRALFAAGSLVFSTCREMQFGEWLREDICQGIYEPAQQDWDIVLLITQILETSIPLKGERAERLFTPAPAAQLLKALRYPLDLWQSTADVQGDEYHIVLTLARIWYTLSTGRFTSKDAAADWLLPQLPEEYAATLRAAQREYLGLEQQDWHILLPAVVRFVDFAKANIPTQFT